MLANLVRWLRLALYRVRLAQLEALCDNLEAARADIALDLHCAIERRSAHIKRAIERGLT